MSLPMQRYTQMAMDYFSEVPMEKIREKYGTAAAYAFSGGIFRDIKVATLGKSVDSIFRLRMLDVIIGDTSLSDDDIREILGRPRNRFLEAVTSSGRLEDLALELADAVAKAPPSAPLEQGQGEGGNTHPLVVMAAFHHLWQNRAAFLTSGDRAVTKTLFDPCDVFESRLGRYVRFPVICLLSLLTRDEWKSLGLGARLVRGSSALKTVQKVLRMHSLFRTKRTDPAARLLTPDARHKAAGSARIWEILDEIFHVPGVSESLRDPDSSTTVMSDLPEIFGSNHINTDWENAVIMAAPGDLLTEIPPGGGLPSGISFLQLLWKSAGIDEILRMSQSRDIHGTTGTLSFLLNRLDDEALTWPVEDPVNPGESSSLLELIRRCTARSGVICSGKSSSLLELILDNALRIGHMERLSQWIDPMDEASRDAVRGVANFIRSMDARVLRLASTPSGRKIFRGLAREGETMIDLAITLPVTVNTMTVGEALIGGDTSMEVEL